MEKDHVEMNIWQARSLEPVGTVLVDRELLFLLSRWRWNMVNHPVPKAPRTTVYQNGKQVNLSLNRVVWILGPLTLDQRVDLIEDRDALCRAHLACPMVFQIQHDMRDYTLSNLRLSGPVSGPRVAHVVPEVERPVMDSFMPRNITE